MKKDNEQIEPFNHNWTNERLQRLIDWKHYTPVISTRSEGIQSMAKEIFNLRARVKELEDQAREYGDGLKPVAAGYYDGIKVQRKYNALREAVRAVRDRYHGAGVPLDDKLIRLFNMVKDDGDNND